MTRRGHMVGTCIDCGAPCARRAKQCKKCVRKGPQPRDVAERVWARIDKSGDCWEWLGAKGVGYGKMFIGSRKDGTLRNAQVTRIVWELTYGPIPEGLFVCHRCDNRGCCRPDHLFLGTCAENLADMRKKGRGHPPTPKSKLTIDDVHAVRALLGVEPQKKIAEQFGVSLGTIAAIACGRSWKMPDSGQSSPKGRAIRNMKLTPEQVLEIRDLIGKKSQYEIADDYGVSQSLVNQIAHGKAWTR